MNLTVKIFVTLFFAISLVAGSITGCSSLGSAMRASPTLGNAIGVTDIPLEELEKLYTDEYSHFMEVNGLRVHYRDVGSGPVIVLVHGIMSSLQTWDGWSRQLEKSYRVISLDVPGYGLTGAPENLEEFDEQFLTTTFSKFIDRLGLERFDLAGNSLGGFISAQYAADFPLKVKRLILLDPVAYPQDVPWVFNFATAPGVSTVGKMAQPPVLVTMNVKDTYGDPSRITEANMNRYVHMAQRPGAKAAYLKTMEMLKDRAERETPLPFHRIKAPTLLMWGERDKWVPPRLAERWRQDIPNAFVKIYPTAGHMPMEEIPEITVRDAEAFLNGEDIPM